MATIMERVNKHIRIIDKLIDPHTILVHFRTTHVMCQGKLYSIHNVSSYDDDESNLIWVETDPKTEFLTFPIYNETMGIIWFEATQGPFPFDVINDPKRVTNTG